MAKIWLQTQNLITQNLITQKHKFNIMAEVMENTHKHEYASNAKGNAALTTGIIGTSLAG